MKIRSCEKCVNRPERDSQASFAQLIVSGLTLYDDNLFMDPWYSNFHLPDRAGVSINALIFSACGSCWWKTSTTFKLF